MNRLMSTRGVFASSEGHSGDAQCAGGRMERGGRVEIITRKPAYPSVTESGTVFPAAAIPGVSLPISCGKLQIQCGILQKTWLNGRSILKTRGSASTLSEGEELGKVPSI